MTTKKHTPEKALLIQQSALAKSIIKKRINEAQNESEALAAACLRVNDLLIDMHMQESGASDFRTFQAWKSAGFKINKGSKAFRIWGTPRRAKNEVEVTEIKTGEDKTLTEEYEFFPMCSLFNEKQVTLMSE